MLRAHAHTHAHTRKHTHHKGRAAECPTGSTGEGHCNYLPSPGPVTEAAVREDWGGEDEGGLARDSGLGWKKVSAHYEVFSLSSSSAK